MTVGQLKSKFSALSNSDKDSIRLINKGRQLEDPAEKLSDLKITRSDIFHVVFRNV